MVGPMLIDALHTKLLSVRMVLLERRLLSLRKWKCHLKPNLLNLWLEDKKAPAWHLN